MKEKSPTDIALDNTILAIAKLNATSGYKWVAVPEEHYKRLVAENLKDIKIHEGVTKICVSD